MITALAALMLAAAPAAGDWKLVWADEFDGKAIDRKHWTLDEDCWGGGNNERQCYTDSARNAAIVDGKLVITALRETTSGPALPKAMRVGAAMPDVQATRDYTSARLSTRGKIAWRYGRIEVRAQLPQGQGTWPAIWMMPETYAYGPWPASGEIDILEAVNLGVPCAACAGGRRSHSGHDPFRRPANQHISGEIHFPRCSMAFTPMPSNGMPGRSPGRWTGKPMPGARPANGSHRGPNTRRAV
jgi:beta-glucanase (GH16 family)